MNLKLNAERFTGKDYVSLYDMHRPKPPKEILRQSLNYLGKPKADIVLDLGCGTGISTQVWAELAEEVIGVEPSEEMLSIARKNNQSANISFINGYGNKINIPSNSLDMVSCSQAFHWMPPEATLKEIDRILKEDSVLLIYDVIWPPSVNYELEMAYKALFKKVSDLTATLSEPIAHRWSKKMHLDNVVNSNSFKYVKESYYHKSEPFSKEQYIGIALSQGGLEALLKRGFTEDEIGISKFKESVESHENRTQEKLTYNYRAIFGIRRKN